MGSLQHNNNDDDNDDNAKEGQPKRTRRGRRGRQDAGDGKQQLCNRTTTDVEAGIAHLPAVDIIHIDSRKIVSYFFSFSVLNV
jgi:hypothetical protein